MYFPFLSISLRVQMGYYCSMNRHQLNNITILVAGATGGVGEGITKVLLQAGASVIAVGRSEKSMKNLQAYVADAGGGKLIPFLADFDQNDTRSSQLTEDIRSQFGLLDGVIIALGSWGAASSSLLNTPDAIWHQTINDNITANFKALRVLVPLLKPQGVLIHLSGASAEGAFPSAPLIGLINAAKKSMVLSLAAEQKSLGKQTRIYEVLIGLVLTRERLSTGKYNKDIPWYTALEIGEFLIELIENKSAEAQKVLHYRVAKASLPAEPAI
jgi:NADP-dependent 3-hydroxy acid dehydrogenase YdfG